MPAKKRATARTPTPPKDYFPLFNSFPPEIHAIILEQCSPIDRVCLQLTCKTLYNLIPRPDHPLSLSTSEEPMPICSLAPDLPNGKCISRYSCHRHSLDAVNAQRAKKGLWPMKRDYCSTPYHTDHCLCFSSSRTAVLHKQLRSWIPREWKYCGTCDMYTFRKSWKKYQCEHGDKTRSGPSMRSYYERRTYWTHRRGHGAFGYKLWKKWFNNAAYDRMEARLQGVRKPNSRYNFRNYKPRIVDSKEMRGRLDLNDRSSSWDF
ncbi:hypothetical protein ACMFMG_003287 [Clarireedia jacksonii]